METLNWKIGQNLVGDGVFVPGKSVTLCASMADSRPDAFQIYQWYSSAMRQILKHIGIPEYRPLFSVQVDKQGKKHWHAQHDWTLPPPRGFRKSAAFVFTVDDNWERRSPTLYSSRMGLSEVSLGGGAGLPAGTTVVGADGHAAFSSTITLAIDPMVDVRVVTGPDLVDHMMANLLEDVGHVEDIGDKSRAARIELAREELLHTLHEAYTPPPSWEIDLSENAFSGLPGQTREVDLELSTPEPGDAYLAVEYRMADDPDVGETTDVVALSVDNDLTVTINAHPEDIALPTRELEYA